MSCKYKSLHTCHLPACHIFQPTLNLPPSQHSVLSALCSHQSVHCLVDDGGWWWRRTVVTEAVRHASVISFPVDRKAPANEWCDNELMVCFCVMVYCLMTNFPSNTTLCAVSETEEGEEKETPPMCSHREQMFSDIGVNLAVFGAQVLNLSCSEHSCSNLIWSDLSCSDLIWLDLSCPTLIWSDLSCSDISCPTLICSDLICSDLIYSDLNCSIHSLHWLQISPVFTSLTSTQINTVVFMGLFMLP